jgi:hypothetical protein
MKKFLKVFAIVGLLAGLVYASSVVYDYTFYDVDNIVSSTTKILDLKENGTKDYLSFQAIYSTKTFTVVSYSDGVRSTGTITIKLGDVAGSTVTVNSVRFVEGQQWTYDTGFTSMSALSLYTILASSIDYISFSLGTGESVIYSTSNIVGTAGQYTFSSTASSVTVTGLSGGSETDISYVGDQIVRANDFVIGIGLLYTMSVGTSPVNLVANTTYYAIPTATTIQLATTKLNAIGGTAIDIQTVPMPGGSSFSLAPILTDAGSAFGFKWQYSNDKENWYDSTLSSVTISGDETPSNYLWDFGFTSYKYIRGVLTAGSFGAIKFKLQGYGKSIN